MYVDGKGTNAVEVHNMDKHYTNGAAIGYCRVSTALQEAEGYSLEAQQEAITKYCADNGYQLLETYTEQASGRNNDREVVNKVLKRTKSTKSTLIIARLDRFTRDLHFLTSIQKQKGIRFIALDNPSADDLIIQILVSVAENESKLISARTRTALAIAKQKGVELGNHQSIIATYNRLEQDRKGYLTPDGIGLWDWFCELRHQWHNSVIKHKNYKTFRKYIDPLYDVVDTGFGWDEYIKKPDLIDYNNKDTFWNWYHEEVRPQDLIGERYKSGKWDIASFSDLCEDAFLMQPISGWNREGQQYGYTGKSDADGKLIQQPYWNDYRMYGSVAFHLPQLDMKKRKKELLDHAIEKAAGLHHAHHIRRFKHVASITTKKSMFIFSEQELRAYDIGYVWKQLIFGNTRAATMARVKTAREEALDIYLPEIEEAAKQGITGVRPLCRWMMDRGIVTPKGNQYWQPSSIQSLLKLKADIDNDKSLSSYKQEEQDDLDMVYALYDYFNREGSRNDDGYICDESGALVISPK